MGRRTILLIAAIVVAALGTGLVWLYADRADDAALADQAPVEVLVAKFDVGAGTEGSQIGNDGAVEKRTLPAASVPVGALSDLTPVMDQVTLGPVFQGQVLLQQAFGTTQQNSGGLNLPEGSMAVSIQLGDPERVAGFVTPGSEIALFATGAGLAGNTKEQTSLLLPRVTVVAVGPTVQAAGESGSTNSEAIPTAIITLAVDQDDAQKVILASKTASLSMGLLDDKSKVNANAAGTTPDNLLKLIRGQTNIMAAILEPDVLARDAISDAIGDSSTTFTSFDELTGHIRNTPDLETVILGPSVDQDSAFGFAEQMREAHPTMGVLVVRRRVDAAVLTQASRSGVREVVAERDLQALLDAVGRSQRLTFALRNPGEQQHAEGTEQGQLITVFSPKGGVGKTTIAVNVGAALATRGLRVLIIDLDLAFGDVPISLALRPEHDFREVINLGERLDVAALRRLVTVHDSGLHILAPPTDPGLSEHVSIGTIRKLLAVAQGEYEYVIVDTAPSLDERSISVMEASDLVFLIATLDIPALKNVKIALETFRLFNFPVERLRLVMNRADSQVGLDPVEVEKSLGVPVLGSIPSSRAVPAAANRGVAIVVDQPHAPVSIAINRLVSQEIVKEAYLPEKRGFRVLRRKSS